MVEIALFSVFLSVCVSCFSLVDVHQSCVCELGGVFPDGSVVCYACEELDGVVCGIGDPCLVVGI